MKKVINFKIVFIFVSFFLLISGCSSSSKKSKDESSNGKIQLTMTAWGNPEEVKGYQKALDLYEEENSHVEIELIPVPSDNYEERLFTQLSGGNAPDVFYAGSGYISKLIETGKLVDLTEFLETDESYVSADEFAEGLWGGARRDGNIYGVTVDNNPFLMYYNKNILKEAGINKSPQDHFEEGTWNWDTFAQITEEIVEAGKHGFIGESSGDHTFSWVWSNGGELYDDDGDIILKENEKAKEAFEYLDMLVENGNITYGGVLPEGQGADAMFMSNQVGFVAAGRWLTPMFSKNESLEFDYIPWPTNTGNSMEPASIATAYLSASKDSDHIDEALKFLSFYTSTEGQKVRLEGNGNAIPSVDGIDELITEESIPEHASYLLDAREIGIVDDKQNSIPGLDGELSDILDLMYLGKQDAEVTIDKFHQKAQEMIEENKE